jgi:hypothetical protein
MSIAHRLKPGPRKTTRPIIVRFANWKMRDMVLRSKNQLNEGSQRVFISEHLTKSASQLFFEARKMLKEKKIAGTWTRNGHVMIKWSTDSAPKLVKCNSDLKSTNGR